MHEVIREHFGVLEGDDPLWRNRHIARIAPHLPESMAVHRLSIPDSVAVWPPSVTVVITTRNGVENIPELLCQFNAVALRLPLPIIIDDGPDKTPEAIEICRSLIQSNTTLIHRRSGLRRDGPAGAVRMGMSHARAPWICVMDADQHPPSLMPRLLGVADGQPLDLVVASRYCKGESLEDFGQERPRASHDPANAGPAIHIVAVACLVLLRYAVASQVIWRKARVEPFGLNP